jgi:hypothetical protein
MNLDDAILDVLNRSELPLKAAAIVNLVKPVVGRAATSKAVAAALESLSGTGRLNRIVAGSGPPLFTTHNLEPVTLAWLKQCVLAAKKEQPAAKLKSRLPTALQPHFETALTQLAGEGGAFVLPGAKRLVYSRRPKPSELLSAVQRRALQKMLDAANGARVQAVTLANFTAWLDEGPPVEPSRPEVPAVLVPDETDLRGWYELDRVRSSTAMIPIPRTFERYQSWAAERGGTADSQVLRNLIEALYNGGSILLEPCERPQDLPEHERALLVPMSLGPPGYSWCWLA